MIKFNTKYSKNCMLVKRIFENDHDRIYWFIPLGMVHQFIFSF